MGCEHGSVDQTVWTFEFGLWGGDGSGQDCLVSRKGCNQWSLADNDPRVSHDHSVQVTTFGAELPYRGLMG